MIKYEEKKEINNNNSYNELLCFLPSPATVFFQENPQLLLSPFGRSVCSSSAIDPVSERSMHFWITDTGAQITLAGVTVSKR